MKKILFVIMVLGLLVVVGCATTQEGLSEEEISTICGDQASAIEEGLTSDEVGIICADFDMGEIQRAPEKTFKKKMNRALVTRAQKFVATTTKYVDDEPLKSVWDDLDKTDSPDDPKKPGPEEEGPRDEGDIPEGDTEGDTDGEEGGETPPPEKTETEE